CLLRPGQPGWRLRLALFGPRLAHRLRHVPSGYLVGAMTPSNSGKTGLHRAITTNIMERKELTVRPVDNVFISPAANLAAGCHSKLAAAGLKRFCLGVLTGIIL